MVENTRKVPGFSRYLLTESGMVISGRSRVLKPEILKQGYHRVTLVRDDGQHVRILVHRLVAQVWIGDVPFKGARVLHRDDDPSNNHYTNLRYGTQVQNMEDAVRNKKWNNEQHGIPPGTVLGSSLGERNGNSRLTETKVLRIRQMLAAGESLNNVAGIFGISRSTAERIKYRKTWRHLDECSKG